jgi:cytochrome c biogenesis protein CcmG, thiol:disulfide interchange protein DsbE
VKRILIAVVIAAVAVAAIVAYAALKGQGDERVSLRGATLDGQSFDLAGTRGTPTVVNFFFARCTYCRAEAPDLVAFAAAHPDVKFVGVAVYNSKAETEAFVSEFGITFPVVYEPGAATAEEWGVTGYPTTFFLDAQGAVADSIVGAASRERFESSLAKAQ